MMLCFSTVAFADEKSTVIVSDSEDVLRPVEFETGLSIDEIVSQIENSYIYGGAYGNFRFYRNNIFFHCTCFADEFQR